MGLHYSDDDALLEITRMSKFTNKKDQNAKAWKQELGFRIGYIHVCKFEVALSYERL